MGFFSWITCDTERSVSNIYAGTEGIRKCYPVYVLIPEEYGGGHIEEPAYEGYGDFGGHDIYDLVVDWNKDTLSKEKVLNNIGARGEYWQGIASDFFDLTEEQMAGKYGNDWKREVGIILACYDKDNESLEYPIKIADSPDAIYEDYDYSPSCPDQGYFYCDEEEDDEDWYDEEDE